MFYVFPRAVMPDVCEQIVKDCKQNILNEASVYNYGNKSGREDPKIRKTSVHFIKGKDNNINELAWHFLREANRIQFNYELTFFQAIQFAEYKDGGFYEWHQDASGIDPENETRKLSLTLVLSNPDTFEGGELQFYNGGRPLEDMGEITAEHSRDFHRVTPVVKGIRHSVVCWCVGPNFK